MINHRLAVATAVALFLTACTPMQTSRPEPIMPGQIDAFSNNNTLKSWRIQGKVGLRNADGAKSGYINWQQCNEEYMIRLSGPLGAGAIKVIGSPAGVVIHRPNEDPIITDQPELLLQQFGWYIPISTLKYWIKGIPADDMPYQINDLGFEQLGWQLTYSRQSSVDNYIMPSKTIAENAPLKVTLIINKWDINPDCSSLL